MAGCWKRTEEGMTTGAPECTVMGQTFPKVSKFLPRVFWGCLCATVIVLIVAVSVYTHLGFSQHERESVKQVRILGPDLSGVFFNQSALVDKQNNVITYSVTSQDNLTSTVLFDMKHGLVCYKPDNYGTCFLRHMERPDYDNVNSLLNMSDQQVNQFWLVGNDTRRQSEFLGVLAGSQVDTSTLQEPVQDLCQQSTIYWTRRADGPGKQRLIYFCIDICFPSNICVSVCFYYLPE
ncbi:BRICHOS domain-containing protein 5 [Engraulis encrasicolus]|uniref:BRICHOS domain-containing protein 5 n=1 Tax=Engraulis encrasicolus TaxID=184585 RepID=UPI002FD32839